MLNIESLYTDQSTVFSREWDQKHVRDRAREQIEKADNVSDLA